VPPNNCSGRGRRKRWSLAAEVSVRRTCWKGVSYFGRRIAVRSLRLPSGPTYHDLIVSSSIAHSYVCSVPISSGRPENTVRHFHTRLLVPSWQVHSPAVPCVSAAPVLALMTFGTGSAAVVYADGHLYFRYQNGVVILIEATPQAYREKGSLTIPDVTAPSWSQPVVAGGRLYLRERDTLYAYDAAAPLDTPARSFLRCEPPEVAEKLHEGAGGPPPGPGGDAGHDGAGTEHRCHPGPAGGGADRDQAEPQREQEHSKPERRLRRNPHLGACLLTILMSA
jgi:hypothetical protein